MTEEVTFKMDSVGLQGWTAFKRRLNEIMTDGGTNISGWKLVGTWWPGKPGSRAVTIAFPSKHDAMIAKMRLM